MRTATWYYGVRDLPHNSLASNLFKMQLYGDVLLVQQSREQSFYPRERYIPFTRAHFDEQFSKKRKKPEVPCMSVTGYAEVKSQMQQELNQFEAKVAEQALPPSQLAKVERSVPTDGRALAKKLKAAEQLPLQPPMALLAMA